MDWPSLLAGRFLPAVMGIVNVTPDSFSDGGRFLDPGAAVDHALRLAAEGADILDVGGESTRPPAYGPSDPVDTREEIRRVVPVIERLAAATPLPISVDTRKAEVGRAALDAGASIVNDVSALGHDPEMAPAVAGAGAAVVLMHMRGDDPRTMQDDLAYGDFLAEIGGALSAAAGRAIASGIPAPRIAIDPGLGFGKSAGQNLRLVARLSALLPLGYPVVLGASRKGFVARFSGIPPGAPPAERLAGSLACVEAARAQGASVVRVHDVAATRRFLAALRNGEDGAAAASAAGASPGEYARMRDALRSPAAVGLESGT
jgi:dihydropteroate synthase